MNRVKIFIATVALSSALATTAHARDSFSIDINIGGHDYAPQTIRTHDHKVIYYGHYRSAPRITYYAPQIRYHHYRSRSYYNNHYNGYKNYRSYKSRRHYYEHSRKHHRRSRNRGYGYNNGWH